MSAGTQAFYDGLVQAMLTGDVKAVEAYLKQNIPILEGPILGTFVNGIIQSLMNSLQAELVGFANKIMIGFEVDGEESAEFKAYQALETAQESGDPNAIQTALNNYHAAIDALVRWDGLGPSTVNGRLLPSCNPR